jgi:hypothetical protein
MIWTNLKINFGSDEDFFLGLAGFFDRWLYLEALLSLDECLYFIQNHVYFLPFYNRFKAYELGYPRSYRS